VNGVERGVARFPADASGVESLSVPWTRAEYPL
jgi:hypothetical protein